MLKFLILYFVLVLFLVFLTGGAKALFPDVVPSWTSDSTVEAFLRGATGYFLGAQVTMLGLLFPIAVALVTLITQREEASSTSSDIQVYYGETLAFGIGASSIALAAVLAMHLLIPAAFPDENSPLTFIPPVVAPMLSLVHLGWLLINFTALWHFLRTSLSFMRPSERALLRRRFAANTSIPRDLMARLMEERFTNAASLLIPQAQGKGSEPKMPNLHFSSFYQDIGEVEVTTPNAAGKTLHDVWLKPLGIVARRWAKRGADNPAAGLTPELMFPLTPGRQLPRGGVLCRRRHGRPLTKFERYVIRQCFRFRKAA